MNLRRIAISVLIVMSSTVYGQMERLTVTGDMADGFADMTGAFVNVLVDGQKLKRIDADKSGNFKFDLEFGRDYVIEFRKQFYATKRVEVHLRNVTPEMVDIGCKPRGWEVGMLKKVEGIDYSMLDKPVGKVFYEPEFKCFDWDAGYSLQVMDELAKLTKELETKQKEYDKQKSAGEKALAKGDYAAAKAAFTAAMSAFPNDEAITAKLADVASAEKAAIDKANAEKAAAAAK
ncbi:MAG: hypothetical protein KDC37_06885, partial [Flavobacteriales bacterium]|nr:hypothetical protein [Flavobacteriales bacterium]